MIQQQYKTYQLKIYSSIEELDTVVWDKLVPKDAVMSHTPFLSVCEKLHDSHLKYFYCIVYKENKAIAVFYLHKILFRGEILSNYFFSRHGATIKGLVNKIIDKMRFSFLSTGNIIASNEPCFYSTDDFNTDDVFCIIEESIATISQHFPEHKIVGHYLHFNFANPGDMPLSRDYIKIDVEPDMQIKLDESIDSFEKYSESIRSKYKKRNRKIYKDGQAMETRILDAKSITKYRSEIHQLYLKISEQAGFNVLQLHPSYFCELKQALGEQFEIEAYFHHDTLVGFTSRILNGSKAWIHFIGLDYTQNKELHIYNRMLLDNLQQCLSKNIRDIRYGRTATEIKSTIGAKPLYHDSYIKHHNCLIHSVLKRYFKDKPEPQWVIRNPFKDEIPTTIKPVLTEVKTTQET